MSHSPKIDEIRATISHANPDFVCITETWLKDHIDSHVVGIAVYNIVRLDRKVISHGDVCLDVCSGFCATQCFITVDLMDKNLEVLRVKIRPDRLPRGIPSIFIGTVYHPPSANNSLIQNYLYESLSKIEGRSHDCGVIFLGDFNKLNVTRIKNTCGIKQIAPFPSRGESKLDLIYTNLSAFYNVPKKLLPFGMSDHDTVKIQPIARQAYPRCKLVLKSSDLRMTKRLAMRKYLDEVDLNQIVATMDSCEEKTKTLEMIIKTSMDIVLPLKSKKVIVNEPPWINDQLKSLIRERQVALTQGDLVNFRRLRNRVNRLRKSCRTKYYASKVEHLRVCDPRRWWKEVKSLGGMQSATRTEPTSFLKHIDAGRKSSLKNLSNIINNSFLAPTDSFRPLAPSWPPDVHLDNSPSVTEYCVFEKLALLNPHKASGPDNVPAWLLEENADILALVVTDIPTQRIRRHGFQVLGNRLTSHLSLNQHLFMTSTSN